MFDAETLKRFWDKVDVRGEDDCWEWKAAIGGINRHNNRGGYGAYSISRTLSRKMNTGCTQRAHRISYCIASNCSLLDIRDDYVLHSCDNRKCCNPAHLRLGTHQDNTDDAVDRGRQPQGVTHGNAVFTEQDIRDIRIAYKGPGLGPTHDDIAADYNVSPTAIWKIVHRKLWKHVA